MSSGDRRARATEEQAPPLPCRHRPAPAHADRAACWPSKDGAQRLAALWLALRLAPAHEYTEPELEGVIASACAYGRPDHGVIRKEAVRRGFLAPPSTSTNADGTTATRYAVDRDGLAAAARGVVSGEG